MKRKGLMTLQIWLHLAVIALAAWGGWRLALIGRVPSANIIGPMVGAGLISMLGIHIAPLESGLQFSLQVMVGCALGLRIDKDFAKKLRQLLGPAVVVSFWALATGLAGALVLVAWANLDQTTALFAATPGGISEMTLAAADFQAHTPTVALLQLSRLSGILLIIPPLVHTRQSEVASAGAQAPARRVLNLSQTGQFLLVAFTAGYLAQMLRLPAGSLVGAMVATAGLSVHYAARELDGKLNPSLVQLAQVGVGTMVGLNFTPDTVAGLGELIWPALLITVVMLVSGLALGTLLHWWTQWDIVTCWLASAPAGITQMGILAEALNANVGVVSTLHVIRLVTVVTVLIPILGIFLAGI